MKKEKHFRILPDFMIRTAMLPLESINEIKTGDEFLTSLEKFIDEGVMGEAILVASSSLSNMLEKSNYNQKDRNSIAFSLYKYISRTFSRTTPFGLFASVGMGTFDNIQKNINFQELEFKKNSRIDMEWLLGFIDSMEKEKHIVAQLRVKANHTIVKSGKRMELLFPTHCGQGEKIEGTITDTISIRLTDASKYTLEKAKEPIVFSNLVDDIYEQYGKEIDRDIVFNFVWEMFRQEFLISELRPPLLGENPVDYLMQLPFESADVSVLIGNILDNAIEASAELPEEKRHIRYFMKYETNILIITVINAFSGRINKNKNGTIITCKEMPENHGIGLDSVRKVADKYHGSVVIEIEENTFIIKIILCDIPPKLHKTS